MNLFTILEKPFNISISCFLIQYIFSISESASAPSLHTGASTSALSPHTAERYTLSYILTVKVVRMLPPAQKLNVSKVKPLLYTYIFFHLGFINR